MADRMTPPLWARAVVAATAPPRDYESVAGDLHEEYVRLVRLKGRAHADAWYCSQAVRSIPSLLSYSRFSEAPWLRIGIAFFVAISLLVMLVVNELAGDVIARYTNATRFGIGAWPYFVAGWLDALVFGFLIAAIVRSYGTRLVLVASIVLVAFVVLPILMHYSSPLSPMTTVLLVGAVPAMCAGAGLYQVFRRR
jgi:hypothetical protein